MKKETQVKSEVKAKITKEVNKIAASLVETKDMRLSKSSAQKLERAIKWEKTKVEKAVKQRIYERANELVETLISIGIDERNPNAINSLLDRGFGKASQNIELDAGKGNKVMIFMPSVLMEKYELNEIEKSRVIEAPYKQEE